MAVKPATRKTKIFCFLLALLISINLFIYVWSRYTDYRPSKYNTAKNKK